MAENKSCENCKYFKRHYVKRLKEFVATDCGHCVHGNKSYKTYLGVLNNCKYWELVKSSEDETEQKIEKVIREMSVQLKNLLTVLKTNDKP